MGIICAFLGAVVGGCMGVVVMCLVVVAKRADQQYTCIEERRSLLEVQELEKRRIQFIDSDGQRTFAIPDDTFVVLTMENGESTVCLCQYLDENHAKIDGIEWKIQKFVKEMEKRGISISPPTMHG